MADPEVARQLKIKVGSVRRLAKELGLYAAERDAEAARVAGMKAAGADEHDVKHAVRWRWRM